MKVSVCMAVFNGAAFLPTVVPSILNQLGANDELIAVDDASSDDSILILEEFKDHRIHIIRQASNQGVSATFFRAMRQASGHLVFITDQDDTWMPHKTSRVKSVFSEREYDLIVHDASIYQGGRQKEGYLFQINKSGRGFLKNLKSDTYTGCCMVLTGEAKDRLLPRRLAKGVYYDHYMGLAAEWLRMDILFLPEPLIRYNRHERTLTQITRRRGLSTILKDRMRLLGMLFGNLVIRW